MIISETCAGCSNEFSIDNADHRVCGQAYSDWIRDHRGHDGHTERITTKKTVFQTLTFEPIVKRTEKEAKGPRQ